jgi:hypothetical protein
MADAANPLPAEQTRAMQAQYGAWPYPRVPLLASLPSTHPFELHVAWLWDRAGSGPPPARPRIWIAGCGTFQPYVFAVANPEAEILATDLSAPSLAIAARRCRWHRRANVAFAPVDLADASTWPEGSFDLIECYGVLMNLPDPLATLRGLAARLTARGVLRLMVYPHWSRARIFQVQRLARLLGLHAADRRHPAILRRLMRRLPRRHPLRFAFTTYHDSRNDAGVVDAFLHAGDRGFSAFELGALLRDAGLVPAYWFHRPWAQPDVMAERLLLAGRPQSLVLDQLDLWQELRGNFTVCLRRAAAPPRKVQPPAPHPLWAGGDLRHRLRLLRLCHLGGRLPARSGDEVVLRAADARALARGADLDRLAATGLVLGGGDRGPRLPAHADWPGEPAFRAHARSLRVGRLAPNPLYGHLFAAFEQSARHPELGLPDLERQIGTWLPWADPLEQHPITYGLTPFGTFTKLRQNVLDHLARAPLPVASDYGALRLRQDAQALAAVRAFVRAHHELPQAPLPEAALRELWLLLFGHESLFVTCA